MGIWKRLTGRLLGEAPAPVAAPLPREPQEPPAADAERYLRGLCVAPDRADGAEVSRAVTELRRAGRERVAIEILQRLVAQRPHDPELRALSAELLLARVDDVAARPHLEWLWEHAVEHGARSAFQLGELFERAGDRTTALGWYERVLARDVRWPNARERADRLRLELGWHSGRAAAPTLFTADGAVAHDRYRLLRELGRGGAGTVYLAQDAELNRPVALKVYHPDQWTQGGPGRRFFLEARTAASLRHPGIVRILDVEVRLRAIVMELVPGGTVASMLRPAAPPLPEAVALEMVRRVLEPLAFVHRRQIVHRDLKPSNLLLREGGEIVISDFGVALVPGDAAGAAETVGTFSYMPPEARRGERATPASDVFAVGTLLGELCARAPDSGRASARLVTLFTAADPAARPRDAAAALAALCARGGSRFRSAGRGSRW